MPPRFRLMDLIVVVGVMAALLTTTIAARHAAQENSVIIGCADKLGQLAQSLVLYESLNDGHFPRTRYDPAAAVTAYTAPDAADPFQPDGPAANDVTASMFLLARTLDLPPEAFTCPSAIRHGLAEEDDFARGAPGRSNFRARVNDNYALANMYPDAAAVAAGYSLDHFRDRLPETFAVAGDTNPGGDGVHTATTQQSRMHQREANSPNHERDGQNVLFADGSVRFYNACFVGYGYDNVYTGRADTWQPDGKFDTVLLPTWSMGPQTLARATSNRRWVLGASALLTFLVVGYVVRHGMARKPSA